MARLYVFCVWGCFCAADGMFGVGLRNLPGFMETPLPPFKGDAYRTLACRTKVLCVSMYLCLCVALRVPLLRGLGGLKNTPSPYPIFIPPYLDQITLLLNIISYSIRILAHIAIDDPHNYQANSPHLPISFLVSKISFCREM